MRNSQSLLDHRTWKGIWNSLWKETASVKTEVWDIVSLWWYDIPLDRDKEFLDLFWDRYIKLKKILALGIEINPSKFDKTAKSTYIIWSQDKLPTSQDISDSPQEQLNLAWRIISIRSQGKVVFFDIQDSHGRIQIYAKKIELSDQESEMIDLLDRWDFIWIEGHPFITRRGEPTLHARKIKFLGKALRPLPDKHEGVKSTEIKYRQPYLDTIMSQESRDKFILRSKVVSEIRRFMDDGWFLEIETPILGNTASWALASSFDTHHNALDIQLNLRIAPETNLKKAVVGGFEKVYEIGKQFRNEWISPNHLQEFTSMEFYWSYVDKNRLMKFTQELFLHILEKVKQDTKISYLWEELDFWWKWPVHTLRDLIYDNSWIDIETLSTTEELISAILKKELDIDIPKWVSRWNLIDLIYKKVARPQLIQPCFVTDHPIDVSPLARRNDENLLNTDRFQLVVNGIEVVNAYGELVDAIDQRLRFEDQASSRDAGDEEAHMMDEEYLTAMEHGMPPISGWWMWIDRLIAMLTDQENLKDTVMFPLNRPKK